MTVNTTVQGWTELADGVFTKRYEPVDITVTAVVGSDGVLVADTRCSLAEAREIKAELALITSAPIRWVVNTHAHWDHVWGNAEFDAPRLVPPAEFWAHENVPQCFEPDPAAEDFKARLAQESPEWAAKVAELELRAPDRVFAKAQTLDLGDRVVKLRHVGRGHTDGDLLLWVPDCRVLVAGDLVEESGPVAYGSDSFPMDWAATLDSVLALLDGDGGGGGGGDGAGDGDGDGDGTARADAGSGSIADATVVPGHGIPGGITFVRDQQAYVRAVADQITELHRNGVPADEAAAAGSWPNEKPEIYRAAILRGYAQLDGSLV